MPKKTTEQPSHVMRYDNYGDHWACTCGYISEADWPDVIQDYEAHKATAEASDS